MADDMLVVAQQALGHLQWYRKSKTEKKMYSHIEIFEDSIQSCDMSMQHFYANF